jgi:hypothetical protein
MMGSSLTGNPPSEARTLTRPACPHVPTEVTGRMAPDLIARATVTLPDTGLSRGSTPTTRPIPTAAPVMLHPAGCRPWRARKRRGSQERHARSEREPFGPSRE